MLSNMDMKVTKTRKLKGVFGCKRCEVIVGQKIINYITGSFTICIVTKYILFRWSNQGQWCKRCILPAQGERGANKILVVKAEEHRLLGKCKCRWKDN